MKVLLLSIIAKCGVFTHVRDLAKYLQKLGIKPVVGFINNEEIMQKFNLGYFDLQTMLEDLKGLDFFFYESPEDLLTKIKDLNIGLVHAHSPLVFREAKLVSDKLNLSFVITLHSVLNWKLLHPVSMRHADCIIAIGPEVAKSVDSMYQEKVHIIFNGIDIERYRPINRNVDKGPLRIIWIGRTNGLAAKGAESLAKAVRILKVKKVPIRAKVVGYAVGANIYGLKNKGWAYNLLPHLHWSHIAFGRGRALREAMACGNVGFLIGEGYGGVVKEEWFENDKQPQFSASIKHGYAELSVSAMVDDILYFHQNRDELKKAREAARSIAEKHFDAKIMAEKTCFVYNIALKRHEAKQINRVIDLLKK